MIFKKISKTKILLLIGDVLIILISLNLAFLIRFGRLIFRRMSLFDGISLTFLLLVIFSYQFLYFWPL